MIDLAELGLDSGDLVLLDSGPLIYLIEGGSAPRQEVVKAFLESARAGKLRLTASTLAWTEALRGPLSRSDGKTALAYRGLLSDSSILRLEPLDAAIADEAARILSAGPPPGGTRTRKGLELADAVHIATAVVLGAAAVLTNDEEWVEWAILREGGQRLPRVLLVDDLAFAFD